MLSELTIENFAIIDRLFLRFESGLTVLTGETGAGKSIIIDALQVALGARAPAEVIREQANLASVEAVFDIGGPDQDDTLAELLAEQGIDDDETLILRREVHESGRSTARINGRAVPLAVLSGVGGLLVDIHGQSDHLSILKRDRQLAALDRFGGLGESRREVTEAVREFARARRDLDALEGSRRETEQWLDLLRFQVGEIEAASLRPDEDAELEAERTRLANAERLTGLSEAAYQALHGESGAALDLVGGALSAVRDLAAIDPSLSELLERVQSLEYELDDVSQELRLYRDGVEHDPQRLEAVDERLDLLSRLKRKYGATADQVIAFGESARRELEDVENLDERVAGLRAVASEAEAHAAALASGLSDKRSVAAERLAKSMREALQGLGLKGTAFDAVLSRKEAADGLEMADGKRYAAGPNGIDSVEFLVSFNPGEPPRPLEKVASGGETSRFLLALKSVLAGADRTPTLIFDEVDVGVGGRHGTVVGERLRALARSHQVLSITHLPQIAALADHHVTVAKAMAGERTTVSAQALERADRVREIAEMLSGTGTETARRTAEELLESAGRRD